MKNQMKTGRTILVFAGMLGLLSGTALAASVDYTITGTLSLVPGDPDPLSLNGQGFKLTATLDSGAMPSPFTTTGTQSAGTFATTTPVVAAIPGLLTATCGGSSPSATIQLTDNVTGSDTINVTNCTLLTLYNMSATIQLPGGRMVSGVPAAFPQIGVSGVATFTPTTGGAPTRFNLTGATVSATGAAPPSITASATTWAATAPQGSTAVQTKAITLTATAPVSYAATASGGAWLTVSPTSGNSSGAGYTGPSLTLSANPSGLGAGSYSASVSVNSGQGTPVTIAVTLTVGAAPTVTVSPTSLSFSYKAGDSAPAPLAIQVTSTASIGVTAAASGGSWLSVSASSANTPSTLTVTVNPTGLTAGSYTGNITVSTPGATVTSTVVPVTLTVTEAAVLPTISGITDGAGFKTDAFAPGDIISIFGANMGPNPYVTFSVNAAGGLDATLSGVSITVDGAPAIPLLAWNQQINAILPYSAKTTGEAAVVVEYNGAKSAAFNIPMVPAAFKLFAADSSGKGPGAILNQDYSPNTATNPAAKGSVVQLFGSGGGALTPAVVEGGVASAAALSTIVAPYSATVNGVDSKVWYAGTAPGLVFGVYQVNVQLPADVASGSANIVVKVGDSQSQPDITVFVQ